MRNQNYFLLCLSIFLFYTAIFISAQGYRNGENHPLTGAEVVYAVDYGVIANDSEDDSEALIAALNHIQSISSPDQHVVLQLPSGTIILSQQIRVEANGVIIKGTGNNPGQGGTKILVKLWEAYQVTAENEPDINALPGKLWPGYAVFRVETSADAGDNIAGSVNFPWKGVNVPSSGGGKAGDPFVTVTSSSKFSVGQTIMVAAADDTKWYQDHYIPAQYQRKQRTRTQMFTVTSINGSKLYLDKALEFDVPYRSDYNSKVVAMQPVSEVGFMDFYLEGSLQDTQYFNDCNSGEYHPLNNSKGVGHRYQNAAPAAAIHSILFKGVENCWVDNLHINMSGSHSIVTEYARYMTIENNICHGSWNKGKGGHGYFRGSKLYDSLIQNNQLRNLRHLAIQWSATGNVIKNNDIDCDLNLHGGWERNNLFIDNQVKIPYEHRSWTEQGPENETWYPIWWAAAEHASKWAAPSGYNNRFINNTLIKQKSPGAAFKNWGLYDSQGLEYTFAGNSPQNWDHLRAGGTLISTWQPEICFYEAPNSGVSVRSLNENQLPTVSITNPANHTSYTEGDNITIDVMASDADGTVVKVEFYSNNNKLGQVSSPPYQLIWPNVSAGEYALTAKATDNEDGAAVSSIVNVIVSNGSVPSDVKVDYFIEKDWGSGFKAEITITNHSDQAINGWNLEFDFPGNQQITKSWSATAEQSGKHVTITNLDWNGTIEPGKSRSFGFNANYSGSNEVPTVFLLNGSPVE